jgi:hypothetical protein
VEEGSQLVGVAEEVEMLGLRRKSLHVEDRMPSIYRGCRGFQQSTCRGWGTVLTLLV